MRPAAPREEDLGPPPGTWSREEVAGHAVEIYEPPEANEHGYVLLYLHGVHLGMLRDQPPMTRLFAQHGLPVVAPVTGQSWWSDRLCPEFDPAISAEEHVLKNVVPFIAERFAARPPTIALFGTSMGGQGALRLAYKHPETFPVVAGIAPAIDYHQRIREGDEILSAMYPSSETARQNTALLHIHPLNWPRHQFFCCDPEDHRWYDSAQRLQMKLWSLGVCRTSATWKRPPAATVSATTTTWPHG